MFGGVTAVDDREKGEGRDLGIHVYPRTRPPHALFVFWCDVAALCHCVSYRRDEFPVRSSGAMSETTLQKVEAEVQKLSAELASVERAQVRRGARVPTVHLVTGPFFFCG